MRQDASDSFPRMVRDLIFKMGDVSNFMLRVESGRTASAKVDIEALHWG